MKSEKLLRKPQSASGIFSLHTLKLETSLPKEEVYCLTYQIVSSAFRLCCEGRIIGVENQGLLTHLVMGGIRFVTSPRLQLSAFYQYNSFDEQGRWNIRASWEYRPLSFLYLVFNDTQVNSLDRNLGEQQVISKLTLMRQF